MRSLAPSLASALRSVAPSHRKSIDSKGNYRDYRLLSPTTPASGLDRSKHHDTRHHRRSKVCATNTICQSQVDRDQELSLLLAVDPHTPRDPVRLGPQRSTAGCCICGSTPSAVISPQTQNATSSSRARARYFPRCSPAKRHIACERIFRVSGSLLRYR
jgi:hypothetical protein